MIGINILLPMIVLKMISAQLIGSTFPSPQVSELPITYTSGEGAIPSSMAALGTYNFKQNPVRFIHLNQRFVTLLKTQPF